MHTRSWRALALAILFLTGLSLRADEVQDRRTDAGLKLFRALLAADLDLPKKAANNKLLIVFFYTGDARRANDLANAFAATDVRGLQVAVETTNDLAKLAGRTPAGIFLADSPSRQALPAIVRYGIDHHVIVYSPFEGDVEKGVLGGLSIEAQVRPFVNQATLDASRIALKPFFLQVAKVYR